MISTTKITGIEGDKPIHLHRKTAAMVGIFYILAAVTAVVGLALYSPILNGPNYLINGAANKNQIVLGAIMELLLVISAIGTAAGLFPFLRKYNESIALGYLCCRLMEAVLVTVGIVSVLSLLTLSQTYAAAIAPDASAYRAAGTLLIAVHAWTFLLGPALMLGVNTALYSSLLYRSRLVPRLIGGMGLAGATCILLEALLVMFGVISQISFWGGLLALPITAFEMTLAVWLIVKGFNPSAVAVEPARGFNPSATASKPA